MIGLTSRKIAIGGGQVRVIAPPCHSNGRSGATVIR